jgi:hypothetical protein
MYVQVSLTVAPVSADSTPEHCVTEWPLPATSHYTTLLLMLRGMRQAILNSPCNVCETTRRCRITSFSHVRQQKHVFNTLCALHAECPHRCSSGAELCAVNALVPVLFSFRLAARNSQLLRRILATAYTYKTRDALLFRTSSVSHPPPTLEYALQQPPVVRYSSAPLGYWQSGR